MDDRDRTIRMQKDLIDKLVAEQNRTIADQTIPSSNNDFSKTCVNSATQTERVSIIQSFYYNFSKFYSIIIIFLQFIIICFDLVTAIVIRNGVVVQVKYLNLYLRSDKFYR